MNEQIKEIWNKAAAHQSERNFDHDGAWEQQVEFLNTFAEMIIDQCIECCEGVQANYFKCRKDTTNFKLKEVYAEGEAASDVIIYTIRKRFGVI